MLLRELCWLYYRVQTMVLLRKPIAPAHMILAFFCLKPLLYATGRFIFYRLSSPKADMCPCMWSIGISVIARTLLLLLVQLLLIFCVVETNSTTATCSLYDERMPTILSVMSTC